MSELVQLLVLVAPSVFAAGGAYAAVRVTLRWHEREIERAHRRLDEHDVKLEQWSPRKV